MPPEYAAVFTRPEVIAMALAVVLAIGAALLSAAAFVKKWLDKRLEALDSIKEDTAAAREQVENEHGPDGKNDPLRVQLDRTEGRIIATESTLTVVVDELRGMNRKLDHATGEIHQRMMAEGEERRQDIQMVNRRIDTLRNPNPGP